MQGEYHFTIGRTQLTLSRGPEIEFWLGIEEGADPAADNDWSLLPFMALSDGAHA
jgi:Transport protein Avl9